MKCKQEIYDYLKENDIWHEITEHAAVFNMEELDAVELPYPDCDAKNLFVRDDKRRSYYDVMEGTQEYRAKYREEQLPKDLEAAYGLGKRLVEKAKEAQA